MKIAFMLLAISTDPSLTWACETVDESRVRELVTTFAHEERVDPALALAVADVESASGASQVSSAGAAGIMQLMPATASALGVTDRCDPQANIRAGIRYLKTLYREFDDPLLMLAAYNAGPARVYGKGGIPEFNETAQYVVKVMNRWQLNAKAVAAGKKRKVGDIEPSNKTHASAPWREAHVWTDD